MDDKRFDDLIRNRIGEYQEPDFDPSALAALHHQVAAYSTVPWYVSYRSEILTASSIVLCTIVILFAQWRWNSKQLELLNNEFAQKTSQVESLKQELDHWKSLPPDTIHVVETKTENSEYLLLLYRISELGYEIKKLGESWESRNRLSPSQNETNALARLTPRETYSMGTSARYSPLTRLAGDFRAEANQKAKRKHELVPGNEVIGNLSTRMIRDVEKHYQNGVGLKVGPVVEISRGIYSTGSSQFTVGYGALADLILSPSLSIETGLKYFKRYYDIGEPNELSKTQLPGVDESSGDLQRAESDYWMLEVPINLKYRYPVNLKTHWLGSVGYSLTLYTKQIFEYDYAFDDGSGGSNFQIHSDYRTDKVTLYPGTLNFSVGISRELKNKKLLETSLFYQRGLGEMGLEKVRTQFLGIRGVYWFTLR